MALVATPGLGRVFGGRLRERTDLPEIELRGDTSLFPSVCRASCILELVVKAGAGRWSVCHLPNPISPAPSPAP